MVGFVIKCQQSVIVCQRTANT